MWMLNNFLMSQYAEELVRMIGGIVRQQKGDVISKEIEQMIRTMNKYGGN